MRLPSFPPRLEEWLPNQKVPLPNWLVQDTQQSWYIGVPFPFLGYYHADRHSGWGPLPPNYYLKVSGGPDEGTLFVGIPFPALVYLPPEDQWGFSALAPNAIYKISD